MNTMKKKYQKSIISLLCVPLLASMAYSENIAIERLSLFLDDSNNVYENRQLIDPINNFPAYLHVSFNEEIKQDGSKEWIWSIQNTSNQNLKNLKLTGFIDIDLNAADNTFFNEHGDITKLAAPKKAIPATTWMIDEPGYYKGATIKKITSNQLDNSSHLMGNAQADDSSMALSLIIKQLRKNETIRAVATLNQNNISLSQQEGAKNPVHFNFYAYQDDSFASAFAMQGGLLTTGMGIKEGNVWVWGFRGSGQQGNGKRSVPSKDSAAKVQSLKNISSITGGAYHLIALDEEGNIYGWGQSGYGETGCPPTEAIYVSTPCKVMSNGVQIAAGEYFSMALDNAGNVWTWGHNLYGQLGNNDRKNSQIPIKVNLNNEKARLIGGAYEGGFAVTEEGHVWAWGDNEASGLGFKGTNYGVQQIIRTPTRVTNLDAYADRITYIAGGNGWGEALLDDGTVIGWGLHASLGQGTTKTNISDPQPVIILNNVKQLYARYVGSIALTEDNKIYTWGQTGGSAFKMIYGESPTLRMQDPAISSIGGGKEHVFYELEDGRMYGVGYNDLYKIDQSKCCAPTIDWPGKMLKIDN